MLWTHTLLCLAQALLTSHWPLQERTDRVFEEEMFTESLRHKLRMSDSGFENAKSYVIGQRIPVLRPSIDVEMLLKKYASVDEYLLWTEMRWY